MNLKQYLSSNIFISPYKIINKALHHPQPVRKINPQTINPPQINHKSAQNLNLHPFFFVAVAQVVPDSEERRRRLDTLAELKRADSKRRDLGGERWVSDEQKGHDRFWDIEMSGLCEA